MLAGNPLIRRENLREATKLSVKDEKGLDGIVYGMQGPQGDIEVEFHYVEGPRLTNNKL